MIYTGIAIWIAGNVTAWFAVARGDYISALAISFFTFAFWLISLDTYELVKELDE